MQTPAPIVFWQAPETVPPVAKFDMQLFWIAVRYDTGKTGVFLAHYINKPLELDADDEPVDPDPHVDEEGEYVGAVGWHSQYDHADFCNFYKQIYFSDNMTLLGWAEYVPPVWNDGGV